MRSLPLRLSWPYCFIFLWVIHPIAFSSCTLSSIEANYLQIEKGALSIVFGVKRFHIYLYGRQFTLLTDHKPLCNVLGPMKGVPTLAAACLQGWAVLLSAYRYDIRYKSTQDHANADCLSRLPLPLNTKEGGHLDSLPVTHHQIQQATEHDSVLSKVLSRYCQGTLQTWPSVVPEELKPYSNRCDELTLEGNGVLWGCVLLFHSPYRVESLKSWTVLLLEWAKWSMLPEAMWSMWWPTLISTLRTW